MDNVLNYQPPMDRIDDMKDFIQRTRQVLDELEKQDKKYRKISQKRSNCINDPRLKIASDLNEKEKEDIRKFYLNCPEGYEVDHIYPLSLGGIHHVTNLQYLTPAQNREKGNSLDWYEGKTDGTTNF